MVFENFEPIFNEAKPEGSTVDLILSHPFVLYVHAPNPTCLRVHVTDFHSNTWEAVRSVEQLEDMRDNIGIGGSWSEFFSYVIASIKSDDVKLKLEGQSKLEGATYATLIAQKAKGMPRISLSLAKLAGTDVVGANGNLSMELYKSFKSVQNLLIQEQERSYQLANAIAAEKEKNEHIESQLELYSKRPPKLQKMNLPDKADISAPGVSSETFSGNGFQNSPDKSAAPDKIMKRVVPAHRRARVRGALLQDSEEEKDN